MNINKYIKYKRIKNNTNTKFARKQNYSTAKKGKINFFSK